MNVKFCSILAGHPISRAPYSEKWGCNVIYEDSQNKLKPMKYNNTISHVLK
jgi:hypothetical protein